jgi:hypothetical protein
VARVLLVVNLLLGVAFAYDRNWGLAVGMLIWAGNCVTWLRTIYACQVTRDEIRIVESVIRSVHEAEP